MRSAFVSLCVFVAVVLVAWMCIQAVASIGAAASLHIQGKFPGHK